MTGRQLPPDTGREISGLKRRVTDLERVLDRVRRTTDRPTGPDPLSFAAYQGSGHDLGRLHTTIGAWRHYRPGNTIDATVVDPTRRISLDNDTFGPWTIRINTAGIYLLGATVTFDDPDSGTGDRYLAVAQVTHDGIPTLQPVDLLPAATTERTRLSGLTPVTADAGSYWTPIHGDSTGAPLAASTGWFWALAVSTATPEPALGDL